MLPGRQENSTEVDELQGVTLEEAGRVLTLERFLRGSRGKACCRDAWELFAFIEDEAGREGSENHDANFQDHWVLMLVGGVGI